MNRKIEPKVFWSIAIGYTIFVYILRYFIPSVGEFFIQMGYLAIIVGMVYFGMKLIIRFFKIK